MQLEEKIFNAIKNCTSTFLDEDCTELVNFLFEGLTKENLNKLDELFNLFNKVTMGRLPCVNGNEINMHYEFDRCKLINGLQNIAFTFKNKILDSDIYLMELYIFKSPQTLIISATIYTPGKPFFCIGKSIDEFYNNFIKELEM